MRRWIVISLLVALLALPAVDGQLPGASLSEIKLGAALAVPLDPGAVISFDVSAIRTCPSILMILAEQDVALYLEVPPAGRGETPVATMHFPQLVCATGARQEGKAAFTYTIPADVARNTTVGSSVLFVPAPLEATEIGVAHEVDVPFSYATTPEPPAPMVEEKPVHESPGLGPALGMMALAAAAVALRRR